MTQILQLKTYEGEPVDTWLTLGEVVGVHIAEEFLADGIYQTGQAHPILRGGGPSAYFEITPDAQFDLTRPP